LKVTKEAIGQVLNSIVQSGNDELFSKTDSELEEYWNFKWEPGSSVEWNTYQFCDLLKLYGSFCRRWEEHHNGSCCVVERVRDKYLMPKICDFIAELQRHMEVSGA